MSPTTDRPLRRLLRNAGMLLGSRVLRDGMGLAALALVARHLGPGGLGVLALLQSYTFTVGWLVNFQTWQAIVRYGAELEGEAHRPGLRGLLRLALVLDGGTALLGGLLGAALAGWAGDWWGWEPQTVQLARWYCLLVILPDWSGAWTGVLRLFDRFGQMSVQGLVPASIKLVGAVTGVAGDWSLHEFVWLWISAEAAGLVVTAALGLRLAIEEGALLGPARSVGDTLREHPGLLRFFVTTNAHATVRMASKEADTLVVGATLGPAGAGLFKIVKQVASVLSRAADPLYQAVYPELARLWSAGDRAGFTQMLRRSTLMGLAAGVGFLALFWIAGAWALTTVLGGDYGAAWEPTLVYLFAVTIATATFAFHPAALAMDRPTDSFVVLLVATVAYFIFLVPGLSAFGLTGGAAAYVLFYLIWAAAIGARLRRWIVESE